MLVFVAKILPTHDIGLSIVLLTLAIKILLYPLSSKMVRSQARLKKLEPELKILKESGLTQEEQAKKTFEIYKREGVNPFSSCLLLLIQFPIIFALYFTAKNPTHLTSFLYGWNALSVTLNMTFLGMFSILTPNIVLAFLTGISQFLQLHYSFTIPNTQSGKPSFQDSLQKQMKYTLPVFITLIAFRLPAAVALYWITSTMVTVLQEWWVKRTV